MILYYLTGYSYHIKEEIKALKPKRKDMKNWWKYNYDFKCWELKMANSLTSKKYEKLLKDFAELHNLQYERIDDNKLKRSIQDFNSAEDFFNYFHKQNNKTYYNKG